MNTLRRITTSVLPIGLGVLAAAAILAPVAGASVGTTNARRCGADLNSVQAEFDIAHASDIWQRFPALGITPELQNDPNPAHVVVFQGPFDGGNLVYGNGSTPPTLKEVICVVQADGTVNVYSDVSRQGTPFMP